MARTEDAKNRAARIVLGGSFNPPTLAHRALMEHAIHEVMSGTGQAAYGLYVPSSHGYVKRKMSRQKGTGRVLYSEKNRLELLDAACGSPLAGALDIEYGDDGKGHTYRTLCRVREKYPDDKIMFLAGADKLRIIPKWRDAKKLLSEFTVLVTCRDECGAEAMIRSDPLLSEYIWAFWLIPELPGKYAGFSSTKAREALMRGDRQALYRLCGYEAAELALRLLEDRHRDVYGKLACAVMEAGMDAVSDLVGYPASNIPNNEFFGAMFDAIDQMPEEELEKFMAKYLPGASGS